MPIESFGPTNLHKQKCALQWENQNNIYSETLLQVKMFLAVVKLNLIEWTLLCYSIAQSGLSNPSSAPYCKILWEAHFTITTNCVKQWQQLIGRMLLSEPSDTFDCIISALQLLSSKPISEDRSTSSFASTQWQKTAGSFSRSFSSLTDSLSHPFPPVSNHNRGFTFSFLPVVGPVRTTGDLWGLLTARGYQGLRPSWEFSEQENARWCQQNPSLSEGTQFAGHRGRPGQEEESRRTGANCHICMVWSFF